MGLALRVDALHLAVWQPADGGLPLCVEHGKRVVLKEAVAHHRQPLFEWQRGVIIAQFGPVVVLQIDIELMYKVGRVRQGSRREVFFCGLQGVVYQHRPKSAIEKIFSGQSVAVHQVGNKLFVGVVLVFAVQCHRAWKKKNSVERISVRTPGFPRPPQSNKSFHADERRFVDLFLIVVSRAGTCGNLAFKNSTNRYYTMLSVSYSVVWLHNLFVVL